MNPLTQSKNTTILIALTLGCFALSPEAQAVDPPPDGGYPNQNTAEGEDALFNLDTGTDNTALGFEALFQTTSGSFNTAVGSQALTNNIGSNNTAVGFGALPNNIRGGHNTAVGAETLLHNKSGDNNTAVGYQAMMNNREDGNTAVGFQALRDNAGGGDKTAVGFNALSKGGGGDSTAIGSRALKEDISGFANTAIGSLAMESNTTGRENTVTGKNAMLLNTTGSENTATGFAALSNNNGNDNTAIGHRAMELHNTGDNNTAIGQEALRAFDGNDNTAIGQNAIWSIGTGNNNIALGSSAGKNLKRGDNNIFIGNFGRVEESNTIRIGTSGTQTATYVAGISGTAIVGDAVVVDGNGQLGTVASSQRFKTEIRPMDKTSEAVLALKPVIFRYKKEFDPNGIPQFGLVAEEVEKVNPDLVTRDHQGTLYTVRYEAVNAMLLNEFIKEHAKVEQLKKDFESKIAEQQKQIEALTAGLQRVSAQVEMSRHAPQTVVDNH